MIKSLLGMLLIAFIATTVSAQGIACGKHDAIVDALKQNYQEERHGIGLAATAGVVEFFVSKIGTWTLIVTTPSGQTCIAAAGKAWQTDTPKPEEQGT